MKRGETDYQARLRRDRRSAVVVLAAIAAVLMAIVAWLVLMSPDGVGETRRTPLYWVLMAPFVYWAVNLASYASWTVRWLKPALYGAPVMSGVAFGLTLWNRLAAVEACGALLGVSLTAALVGGYFFRGSLLAQVSQVSRHS